MLRAALRGMVREVDPEGDYLTVADRRAQERGPRQAADVGMVLGARRGVVVVAALYEGGPAAGSGLQAGDTVLAVDGQSVLGLPESRIAPQLRGAVGSRVALTVLRNVDSAPLTVQLERRLVQPPPARARVDGGDVLVLKVQHLRESTVTEVVDLLRAQPVDLAGLVLDLRGNPGGLLDGAIALAALFLPSDTVVGKTVGPTPESNVTYRAHPTSYTRSTRDPLALVPPALRRLPMVVLVDGSTASGAEILAGALRDNGRARLVGRRSFGRGSIQILRNLGDGEVLRHTSARWQLPSGQTFDPQGLTPDVELPGAVADRDVDEAIALLRKR
jgi:carboxyl-terminal processing protease